MLFNFDIYLYSETRKVNFIFWFHVLPMMLLSFANTVRKCFIKLNEKLVLFNTVPCISGFLKVVFTKPPLVLNYLIWSFHVLSYLHSGTLSC